MKVLITGALGMIGRSLTEYLGQAGHELRLMDIGDPASVPISSPWIYPPVRKALKLDWPFLRGDIANPEIVAEAVRDVDAIVHLGGIPHGNPAEGVNIFRTNALGTFILFDEARKAGVRRVIAASSVNAFGTFYWRLNEKPALYARLPLDESVEPVPDDPYSLSKLVNEETCAAFHRSYGITTAALRFTGVWTDEVYQRVREDHSPTLHWDKDLFSWVHICDVVEGITLALEASDLPGYGAYTICASDTSRLEPTMELLERFRPDLLSVLTRPLQGRESLLSNKKAHQTFGYTPRYRLTD
ncbi:hypothetical protein KDA_41750 [Dictyobacter alpinus]|uniref:NAD-dependent epimerase/dehydratase domain-containing protein n=1 Tax=Dictyobacter alpinus TaxID=2014873 RepID=A0A402BB84_9CHLR|nr:NAD(P)-dependent oxidoreductase [Dictyobacter alpinus]GCE28691.1 hypothetical protein KDA_41750 [Dictyobacter alpinus]